MTTVNDIKWGSYQQYEGPYYSGNSPFKRPDVLTPSDIAMAVVTATEGGSANAINMYDRMIVSVGFIQFGEAGQFSVSDLLGKIIEDSPETMRPLADWMAANDVSFDPSTPPGHWRFSLRGVKVLTTPDQRRLFLKSSDGTKGSWDDDSKAYAKGWAAALASSLAEPDAVRVQTQYVLDHLMGFVLPEARAVVFRSWTGDEPPAVTNPWEGAMRAAYLSFAANNPRIANEQTKAFFSLTMKLDAKSVCIGLLRQLTFGPKIAIYPERYNKIRPVLEQCFGIDLPDFAENLEKWRAEQNIDPTAPDAWRLESTKDIQQALVDLNYDIGPTGADGVMGQKTKDAIVAFQTKQGLSADGIVGKETRAALVGVLETQRK